MLAAGWEGGPGCTGRGTPPEQEVSGEPSRPRPDPAPQGHGVLPRMWGTDWHRLQHTSRGRDSSGPAAAASATSLLAPHPPGSARLGTPHGPPQPHQPLTLFPPSASGLPRDHFLLPSFSLILSSAASQGDCWVFSLGDDALSSLEIPRVFFSNPLGYFPTPIRPVGIAQLSCLSAASKRFFFFLAFIYLATPGLRCGM